MGKRNELKGKYFIGVKTRIEFPETRKLYEYNPYGRKKKKLSHPIFSEKGAVFITIRVPRLSMLEKMMADIKKILEGKGKTWAWTYKKGYSESFERVNSKYALQEESLVVDINAPIPDPSPKVS